MLEVLAEEFDADGKTADVDINGFAEINGLVLKDNRAHRSSKPGARNSMNDDYKGSLSAIRTMKVSPGVILKEFANDKKRQVPTDDYVKVSGGDFRPRPRSRATESSSTYLKQMSTNEY